MYMIYVYNIIIICNIKFHINVRIIFLITLDVYFNYNDNFNSVVIIDTPMTV